MIEGSGGAGRSDGVKTILVSERRSAMSSTGRWTERSSRFLKKKRALSPYRQGRLFEPEPGWPAHLSVPLILSGRLQIGWTVRSVPAV